MSELRNIKKTTKKQAYFVGEISSFVHRQDKALHKLWNKFLRGCEKIGVIGRATLEKYYSKGRLVRADKDYNIIANAGFNVLAQILTGEYADTGAITHMALGDGVGAPAVGDVALFNEVYRNPTASSTSAANVAICTAFFTEVEVDGVFTEFGNFIDGEAGADTGELWSHINNAWEKTDMETLTVQCKYTLTNKP